MYTSMHSAGLELTKLTYTRNEDNLIRHATGATGDASYTRVPRVVLGEIQKWRELGYFYYSFTHTFESDLEVCFLYLRRGCRGLNPKYIVQRPIFSKFCLDGIHVN